MVVFFFIVTECRKFGKNLCVDDLLSRRATAGAVTKEHAIEIFDESKFYLQKWHSNVPLLEGGVDRKDSVLIFAKQQLQQPGELKASLSGLGRDKKKDVLSVKFPTE